MASELRLDLDPILGSTRVLVPLIDPKKHSCGTVPPHGVDELAHPEPSYHAVGAKSYGRAPTFLPRAVEITAPAGRGLATGISGGQLTVIEDQPSTQATTD
jgi:hypothetical protein